MMFFANLGERSAEVSPRVHNCNKHRTLTATLQLSIHPSRQRYNRDVHDTRSVATTTLYSKALRCAGSTSALRYANPSDMREITGLR